MSDFSSHVRRMDGKLDRGLGDRCVLHIRGTQIPLSVPLAAEEVEVREGDHYATVTRVFISVQVIDLPPTVRDAQLERVDPYSPEGSEAEWFDVTADNDTHNGRRKLYLVAASQRKPAPSTRAQRISSHDGSHSDTTSRVRGNR